MAVLMRKPELVKRYSCVLQILESTIDLQNDDKLVSGIQYESSIYCVYKCKDRMRHHTQIAFSNYTFLTDTFTSCNPR